MSKFRTVQNFKGAWSNFSDCFYFFYSNDASAGELDFKFQSFGQTVRMHEEILYIAIAKSEVLRFAEFQRKSQNLGCNKKKQKQNKTNKTILTNRKNNF